MPGFTAASPLWNIASKERIALAEVTSQSGWPDKQSIAIWAAFLRRRHLYPLLEKDPIQNKPPNKEVKRVSPTCLL
jgi:hypothetical protein